MPNQAQITRLSNCLYLLTTATLFALPLLAVWGLVSGWSDPASLAARFAHLPPGTTLTPMNAAIASAIGAITLPPALMALVEMRGLFRRYAAGEILTGQSAGHIRRIGQILMALALLGVMIPTFQVIALTSQNPPGQRVLSVGLTSDTMGFLLAGGLLVVIGWAMAEGARAAEENASFI